MPVAQHRLEPSDQRRVRQQAVEIHRRLGHRDRMPPCGDHAVQVSQRLGRVERVHLGHEGGEEIGGARGLGDEIGQRAPPVATLAGIGPVDERSASGVGAIGGRQPGQGQMVAALEMGTFGFEARAALLFDQPGCRIGEATVRITQRLAAFGLEVQRPAGAEALEDIVGARAGRDQFGLGRAFKIGAPKGQHAQEAAVLVEDDPIGNQRRPWQMVGEAVGTMAVFCQAQHVK